ncbi:hypothetical protein BV22DRAFT_1134239 [Leucogyrophana mollusca]|uniref:Uncharacterized protein n=1 Tax=Leucogyrophana mollusca TaxID=85980 RepID=A0ACB8B2F8_9AGAM|nr:hypothetical protein BV22DRAFT_1134239 [Leucogyrophana mollusca]
MAARRRHSVLSSHSQIFCRLFDLPNPYHGEIMTGCPVIYSQDSSAQFVRLLMTLYRPFYPRDPSFSFDLISAILRLSTKYRTRNLRQSAVNTLKLGFPSTLESFEDPKHARP